MRCGPAITSSMRAHCSDRLSETGRHHCVCSGWKPARQNPGRACCAWLLYCDNARLNGRGRLLEYTPRQRTHRDEYFIDCESTIAAKIDTASVIFIAQALHFMRKHGENQDGSYSARKIADPSAQLCEHLPSVLRIAPAADPAGECVGTPEDFNMDQEIKFALKLTIGIRRFKTNILQRDGGDLGEE
jgi:hypothetical protein